MNPGGLPFKRYNRWSKTSASDENNLRAAVEDLQRAARAEGAGAGDGLQTIGGVPVSVPRQEEEFWIEVQGAPEGSAPPIYHEWTEVIQDGFGSFEIPADAMTGAPAFPAYELAGRVVPVGTIGRAWLSQSDPLVVMFDGNSGLRIDGGGLEVSGWCNCTTPPLVLQDQENVSAVLHLGAGLYRVLFSVTFRTPESFEWSGNCKANAFVYEVTRTASSVTVQVSTNVDAPRWGIDFRGHLGIHSGSGSGSGPPISGSGPPISGSGPPPPGGGATCADAVLLVPDVITGPFSVSYPSQQWFKYVAAGAGLHHIKIHVVSGAYLAVNIYSGSCAALDPEDMLSPGPGADDCYSAVLADGEILYIAIFSGDATGYTVYTIDAGTGGCP